MVHVVGDAGHVADHNTIEARLTPAPVALTGTGIDPTGVSDSTAALQAAITAAVAGATLALPIGVFKFSTLTLDSGKSLIGAGWSSLRDAVTTFGDANYATAGNFGGTVLRSTATSGHALTVITAAATSEGGALQDFILIGPGSGTSTGVHIGSTTRSVVNPIVRNVKVANFATGVLLENVNEGSFYDLKVRGCTTGLKVESNTNNCAFYLLDAERCTDGVVLDSTTLADSFYTPIVQGLTGTGFTVNGSAHLIANLYAESASGTRSVDVVSGNRNTILTPYGSSSADDMRVQSGANYTRLLGCDLTHVTDSSTTSVSDSARPWTAVAGGVGFQNSWANAAGYATKFRRSPDGATLEVSGGMDTGSGGTVAFTLPAGFRPNTQKLAMVADASSGGTLQAIIGTNGDVTVYGGSASDVRVLNIQIPLDA